MARRELKQLALLTTKAETLFFRCCNDVPSQARERALLRSLQTALSKAVSAVSKLIASNAALRAEKGETVAALERAARRFENKAATCSGKDRRDAVPSLLRLAEVLLFRLSLLQKDVEERFSPPQKVERKRGARLLFTALGVALTFAVCLFAFTREDAFTSRLKGLEALREALETYRRDTGGYPDTGGKWAFLATDEDGPGRNILSTLHPAHLREIPLPPGMDREALKGFLYRSNGKDFKLIAHNVEDCARARDTRAELIDPARRMYGRALVGAGKWKARGKELELVPYFLEDKNRYDPKLCVYGDCFAYGFWTDNAVFW